MGAKFVAGWELLSRLDKTHLQEKVINRRKVRLPLQRSRRLISHMLGKARVLRQWTCDHQWLLSNNLEYAWALSNDSIRLF